LSNLSVGADNRSIRSRERFAVGLIEELALFGQIIRQSGGRTLGVCKRTHMKWAGRYVVGS
jgi:hypothetical protein